MTSKEADMKLSEQQFPNEIGLGFEDELEKDGMDLQSSCYNGTDADHPSVYNGAEADRNEKNSINQISMSQKEASRIRMFRVMVAGMLVMTGLVTGIAYYFLTREENRNFETAVSGCAKTSHGIL